MIATLYTVASQECPCVQRQKTRVRELGPKSAGFCSVLFSYSGFAKKEGIQLEQIESDKFTKGAYNLGRIDAVHSKLSAFYPDQEERAPATKYLGLQLKLFWWLEVNGTLSTQDKVDKLYDLMTGKTTLTGTDYESITNRELTINTKGEFPTKV